MRSCASLEATIVRGCAPDLLATQRQAAGLVTRRAADRPSAKRLTNPPTAATHPQATIATHSNRPDPSHFLDTGHPRTRSGPSYFPSFLEPRRRSEQAIIAVVLEAYVNGVSTRKVDRLVEQLGIDGMTKDRVSGLCRALDEQVELFRCRPLEGAYPYLWLDAKVRHEALLVRVGCEAPPPGCRGSPVKLRAA